MSRICDVSIPSHPHLAGPATIPTLEERAADESCARVAVPSRWTKLILNRKQRRYLDSKCRFNIVPAGRRGGKSEIAKRRGVRRGITCRNENGWIVFGAPTHAQAKRIFWSDIKALVPPELVIDISESELSVLMFNGCKLQVMGMDSPERAEGPPLDHVVLDEYGNMKPTVWTEHLRPSLTDRMGTADFTGVPEGRNHYYDLTQMAKADESGEWGLHHWTSAEVLPLYLGQVACLESCINDEERSVFRSGDLQALGALLADRELTSARRSMDELTYNQEYLASFVAFSGRCYYPFSDEHIGTPEYDPNLPLCFCFDFNVDPGTAVVLQDTPTMTNVIGEVYIERDSRTPKVCRKLLQDWGHHPGQVRCYGDATGGARGSAKIAGSDWDLINAELRPVFGERLSMRVPRSNPAERVRVNSVNSRLKSMDNQTHVCIHKKCVKLIRDLEGVRVLEGSAGDIDKKNDKKLTHISDAFGYYIVFEHSIARHVVSSVQI